MLKLSRLVHFHGGFLSIPMIQFAVIYLYRQ
uniref:Uncharacterized protein n=1 Tax=Rhizophora mucronata TaxID=61149 RepID=A0A2P2PN10_RHIMU